MKDFLASRPVYRPLNGFAAAIREEETGSVFTKMGEQLVPRATTAVVNHVSSGARSLHPDKLDHCEGKPEIELIQTEGRIDQIIVTCRCGERITLQCSY